MKDGYILLCPNAHRDHGLESTLAIAAALREHGHEVRIAPFLSDGLENTWSPDIPTVTLPMALPGARLVVSLGGYRYAVPAREDSGDQIDRLRKIFRECVVSFDTAQNIVVIHTLPGLANAAASMLDNIEVPNLVGTLAGDDTAFLAMRDVQTALDFCREIEAML